MSNKMKVYLYSLIVNINSALNVMFYACLLIYVLMYKYSYPQEQLLKVVMLYSFITMIFIPNDKELAIMMNIKELTKGVPEEDEELDV